MAQELYHPQRGITSQDLTFLFRPDQPELAQAVPVMLDLTYFTAATHYPDGVIKPGTLVAQLDSGGDSGNWGAYVHDSSAGTGLDTADGMVYSGGIVKRDEATGDPIFTDVQAAVLPKELAIQIVVANLPGLLDEALADYAPDAADLPSGFLDMSAYA